MTLQQRSLSFDDSVFTPVSPPLCAGYYEYANGWNDRALYLRVQYLPLESLRIELYIDFPKPAPDVELKVSLGASAARFMSLIGAGSAGWPCHGQGIGSLLGNCMVLFLQAIYPPRAVLTGWTQTFEFVSGEEAERLQARRQRFWAGFGVHLDDYNMFDVRIGDLNLVDNGDACLGYFPRILPLAVFHYAGPRVRAFYPAVGVGTGGVPWPAAAGRLLEGVGAE